MRRECPFCGNPVLGRPNKVFCSSKCRAASGRRSDKRPQSAVFGVRFPKFRSVPAYVSSAGPEAIELVAEAGLVLDLWQRDFLTAAMGRDSEGRWTADEACLVVPRQNGKSEAVLARALWGPVLGGEGLVLWSAHEFKTARESFLRLKALVETPAFERFAPVVSVSHGKEGITFGNGNRILFIARTRTSGRGFSPDLVILDEAFELDDLALAALKPALSAARQPAMWYASSAPHETSPVLRRVALRGRSGEASRLAYFEWTADDDAASSDVSGWLAANPGIGHRLTLEFTASELEALSDEDFRRERLGIWQVDMFESVFDARLWASLANLAPPEPSGVKTLAIDVAPDRRRSCIAAAGDLGDGKVLVEIIAEREGVSWVVDEVAALVAEHSPGMVLVDGAGQSQTLIAPLEKAGVSVRRVNTGEMVAASGQLLDAVTDERLTHMDQPELNAAVEVAKQRNLGDGWAWARRTSKGNITPLVAVSLAVFGVTIYEPPKPEFAEVSVMFV